MRQSIKFIPTNNVENKMFRHHLTTRPKSIVDCPIIHKANFLEGVYTLREKNQIHTQYRYIDNVWYIVSKKDNKSIHNKAYLMFTFNLLPNKSEKFWKHLLITPFEILNYKWKVLKLAYNYQLQSEISKKRLKKLSLKIKLIHN